MAADFPAAVTNIARPTAQTKRNAPGYEGHALHNKLADEVEAIEALIGITGSQVAGTVQKRLADVTITANAALPATQAAAGALIDAAADKATPADADSLALSDSAASGILKRLSWANIMAALEAHFRMLENRSARNVGVIINSLSSASGIAWSGTTGATGGVDGSFPGLDGENTLWIECPAASGGTGYARAILTQNHRFASTDYVSVRVHCEKASALRFVQIQLVQGSVVLTNSFTSDGSAEAGEWGWYTLTWKLSDFSVSGGSADYNSDFTSFRFQIGAGGSGGAIGKIAFSKFMKNALSVAYAIFSNDSGYTAAYDVRKHFAAAGLPLTISARSSVIGTAEHMNLQQLQELHADASGLFEITNYPEYMPALSHTTTGVAASQSVPGAGNLSLNGSLCSAGQANLQQPRKLVLSGTAVSRTVMFTVTGSLSGQPVTEIMLGPAYANGKVESAKYYDTVTGIAVSGAITGTCTVGTAYSVAEMTANIEANAAALRSVGLGGNEYHVTYPGGEISASLATAMSAVQAESGRTTYALRQQPRNMLLHDAGFNPYLLSGINLGADIATLKAVVDDLVARGGVMEFYFHTIAATVDGVNPTIGDLADLLAYVKDYALAGRLRVISRSNLSAMLQSRVVV